MNHTSWALSSMLKVNVISLKVNVISLNVNGFVTDRSQARGRQGFDDAAGAERGSPLLVPKGTQVPVQFKRRSNNNYRFGVSRRGRVGDTRTLK